MVDVICRLSCYQEVTLTKGSLAPMEKVQDWERVVVVGKFQLSDFFGFLLVFAGFVDQETSFKTYW